MSEKLVRDLIPDIIRADGHEPKTRILSDEEYVLALDEKLREEVAEYLEANDLNELADVLEVIHAIAEARESSYEQIEFVREEKHEKRGGFSDKISLSSE